MQSVWAARYNPMVYESDIGIISLHKSSEGAEKAVKKHKKTCEQDAWEFWDITRLYIQE